MNDDDDAFNGWLQAEDKARRANRLSLVPPTDGLGDRFKDLHRSDRILKVKQRPRWWPSAGVAVMAWLLLVTYISWPAIQYWWSH